jgi:hypothetical protein
MPEILNKQKGETFISELFELFLVTLTTFFFFFSIASKKTKLYAHGIKIVNFRVCLKI